MRNVEERHWLLWLGDTHRDRMSSFEDLGIELAPVGTVMFEGEWFCWLRADTSHRYSRFLHVRHLRTTREVIALVEALTDLPWDPRNHIYGSAYTPEQAEHIRRDRERLDHRIREQGAKWSEVEKDDTRGRALPGHLEAHAKGPHGHL